MKISRGAEQGFTLLEILVAMTLIVIVAVGIWSVMRTSLRSWSKGTEFADRNQRNRSIMDMVRKQIGSAYNLIAPPDPNLRGMSYPVFRGAETGFQFISLNSLQFQESPGLTLVSYEISDSTQGGFSLIEKESRYLGQLPDFQNAPALDRTTPILDNLSSCEFRYYDPGNNEIPPEWMKEWDAKTLGRLPAAVSITMVSRDPGGNILNREMIMPVQASNVDSRAYFRNPLGARGF
jgi:prepilin-type N-terminal cleavage/methylation domain-containing protein